MLYVVKSLRVVLLLCINDYEIKALSSSLYGDIGVYKL